MNGYALEFILSLFSIGWGIWLLLPFNTFATPVTFKTMAALAPEEVWGFVMFLLGFIWLLGIWSKRYHIRRWASLFSSGIWWFISVMFWTANIANTASAIYPIIALACGLAHIRMKRGKEHAK